MSAEIPDDIIDRLIAGEATKKDAQVLLRCDPILIFKLADRLRSIQVGNTATYIVNRNINFSDQCIGTCSFCAFKGHKGFRLTTKEIIDRAEKAVRSGATEVCIQGGLMEDMFLEDYCTILDGIKSRFPQLHIHAFSPMEVFHMAKNSKTGIIETLQELKRVGLDTMPGTAAEILSERVRRRICPDKLTAQQWTEVIMAAHREGIPTTATMMYGHIETEVERIDHILRIRDIQAKTGGFTEFVPLPFMPYNNPLGKELMAGGVYATTGVEDLIVHAIARILLFPHVKNIQCSWVKLGKKLSQFSLLCGVNDLGGTLMEEKISKSAGAANGEYMSPEEFEWIIRGAGRDPVRRDTLYQHLDNKNLI
ncbi:MAG: 7,8-didemethyl-8-hydroxy-5-deazariboflavin synthase subunit CofH [ANME-2 cluster archaeon]|nr:7,8-didemethyl-8-hydroxy-5-deazariboflavin synthase subunit CofH [ANME-2 cluster archaeon]